MAFLPSVITDTVRRYQCIGCLLVELSRRHGGPSRRCAWSAAAASGDAMSPDRGPFWRWRLRFLTWNPWDAQAFPCGDTCARAQADQRATPWHHMRTGEAI